MGESATPTKGIDWWGLHEPVDVKWAPHWPRHILRISSHFLAGLLEVGWLRTRSQPSYHELGARRPQHRTVPSCGMRQDYRWRNRPLVCGLIALRNLFCTGCSFKTRWHLPRQGRGWLHVCGQASLKLMRNDVRPRRLRLSWAKRTTVLSKIPLQETRILTTKSADTTAPEIAHSDQLSQSRAGRRWCQVSPKE